MTNLSPPQRPLCVVGGLGRKKYRARGARWEGEREKRSLSFNVLFSHRPPRAFHFSITAFFIGIPSGSLCGGERWLINSVVLSCIYFMWLSLIKLCVFNSDGTHLFGTHKTLKGDLPWNRVWFSVVCTQPLFYFSFRSFRKRRRARARASAELEKEKFLPLPYPLALAVNKSSAVYITRARRTLKTEIEDLWTGWILRVFCFKHGIQFHYQQVYLPGFYSSESMYAFLFVRSPSWWAPVFVDKL